MGSAYFYAILSLVSWSLYPVLTAYGILEIDPVLFVVIVQVSAGLGSLCFALPLLKRPTTVFKRLLVGTTCLKSNDWLYLFGVGLCSSFFNVFLVFSMLMMSPAASTIIVQTAPIFTMLFSYVYVRKNWHDLGWKDAALSLIALGGSVLAILGNPDSFSPPNTAIIVGITSETDSTILTLAGALLAWFAAIMLAFSDSMRAQVSNFISRLLRQEDIRGDKIVAASFVSEVLCRVTSIIPAIAVWYVFGANIEYNIQGIVSGFIVGFVIFNVASAAFSISILRSNSPTIVLIDFLSPALSVLWLAILGLALITSKILLGLIIVIVANVVIFWMHRETPKPAVITDENRDI